MPSSFFYVKIHTTNGVDEMKQDKKELYQSSYIYACANIEGAVEEVFYMIMDSKNKVNYLVMDNNLIEIPMNEEDQAYMPIHMSIDSLIDIYNRFFKNIDSDFKPLKLKKQLSKEEVIHTIYLLDFLLRDSFLQVARQLKQKQDSCSPQKKKTLV